MKKFAQNIRLQMAAILLFGISVTQTGCIQPNLLMDKNNEQQHTMTVRYDYPRTYYDKQHETISVFENDKLVLRYLHEQNIVPEDVDKKFARGNYVSELYGLNGELLTEDFPSDHLHHRAINWSWATVKWQGKMRDLFAVRGIWARPVRINRMSGGDAFATIDAESQWKWDDQISIVHERVIIRVFRQAEKGRAIDFEIRLTALVDDLEFCGRLGRGYSGFNIRMAPTEQEKTIAHNDPPSAEVRRSWGDYSAEFENGKGVCGITVLQNKSNPLYPSEWYINEKLNYFNPQYPGGELIPMPKGKTIILKYRLWVHSGHVDEKMLSDLWDAYNSEN